MKNSAQKIRTSHVGRLPVPSGFEETALRLTRGEVGGEEVAAQVVPVVADVVKRQVDARERLCAPPQRGRLARPNTCTS